MSSEPQPQEISRRILQIARAQGILTDESFQTLVTLDGDACDHAIARDLISTADVERLRPLADPDGFLPGYQIEELIGQGASGTVYRATHTALGRNVALKLLKSGVLDDKILAGRSQLEARIGASLQHPGIVTVHDYGVHHQRIYLAMEFLRGESLEEVIDRDGAIDPLEALKIVRQVAIALRYATSEGVVHRDIKPANLMLVQDNAGTSDLTTGKVIKVTDFGLASTSQDADATRLTVAGSTLGTPCYVAPEQLESTDVDQRADIYALGATMFHMVTGRRPFGNANAFKALAAKMQGSEEWLQVMDQSVPEPVRQLVVDMTRSDPSARIPDYETLEARISRIVNSQQVAAAAIPQHEVATVESRSQLWSWVVGVVVLGAATFGLVWFWPADRTQPSGPVDPARTTAPSPPQDTTPDRQETRTVDEFRLLNVRKGLPDERMQTGWRIGKDKEQAPVLVGEYGWIRYGLKEPHRRTGFHRFGVTIDTSAGSEVDVCFGLEAGGLCNLARVQKDRVVLGRGRVSDDREPTFGAVDEDAYLQFEPAGLEQPTLRGTPHLSTIHVERQPKAWFINVNGRQLGTVAAMPGDDPAIYLRVNSGIAFFSDTWVYALEPTPLDGQKQ